MYIEARREIEAALRRCAVAAGFRDLEQAGIRACVYLTKTLLDELPQQERLTKLRLPSGVSVDIFNHLSDDLRRVVVSVVNGQEKTEHILVSEEPKAIKAMREAMDESD